MIVRIYHLDRGIQKTEWLCPWCLAKSKKAGWEVKGTPPIPPHALTCQGCNATGDAPQAATVTPEALP